MYEMGDLQQGIRPMTLSLFFIAPPDTIDTGRPLLALA